MSDQFDEASLDDTVDTSGATADTLQQPNVIEEGFYYVQCVSIERGQSTNGTDRWELSFLIVGGTSESEIGKTHTEHLYNVDKDFPRRRKAAFALALGCISEEDIGTNVSYSWRPALESYCCVEIQQETFTGNNGQQQLKAKIRNVWHPDAPEASSVPRGSGEVDVEI